MVFKEYSSSLNFNKYQLIQYSKNKIIIYKLLKLLRY